MTLAKHVRDLAHVVVRHFPKEPRPAYAPHLDSLLEATFIASTITDEGRPVSGTICVFDGSTDSADTPNFLRSDRWSLIPLAEPITLTPEHLARLSQAIRPDAGAIAVRLAPGGHWSIWAVVDQEHLYYTFRHHKGDKFYPRAGKFQIEIVGPGCIAVYHNATLLARLQRDALSSEFQDVFHEGPVAKMLDRYVCNQRSRVLTALRRWDGPSTERSKPRDPIGVPGGSFDLLVNRSKERWLEALSGTLLGMRDLRHGGALLIVPKATTVDLNIKHRINYDRMTDALVERSASEIEAWVFRHFGVKTYNAEDLHCVFRELEQADRRHFDATRAVAGAMQFIASLSGVDGLVLAVRGMNIRGFGVEITAKRDPRVAFLASNALGTSGSPIDPTRWGTRHRSMMRYCAQHEGSVGFVVSQDGDVKAVMRVENRVVVWPNITVERNPFLPFEVPCPHCSLIGGLYPVGDSRAGDK